MAQDNIRMDSADDLLAVAAALEREAAARYRALSARMLRQGDAALAAQFDGLAAMEDRHAGDVAARSEALLGHAPSVVARAGNCRRPMMKRRRAARRSAPIRRSPSPCAMKSAPSFSTLTSPPKRKIPACMRWPRHWRATSWSTLRCCGAIGVALFIRRAPSPSKYRRPSKSCARRRGAGTAKLRRRTRRWRRRWTSPARPRTRRTSGASPPRRRNPRPARPRRGPRAAQRRGWAAAAGRSVRSFGADRRAVEQRGCGGRGAAAGRRDGRPPRPRRRRARQRAARRRPALIAFVGRLRLRRARSARCDDRRSPRSFARALSQVSGHVVSLGSWSSAVGALIDISDTSSMARLMWHRQCHLRGQIDAPAERRSARPLRRIWRPAKRGRDPPATGRPPRHALRNLITTPSCSAPLAGRPARPAQGAIKTETSACGMSMFCVFVIALLCDIDHAI